MVSSLDVEVTCTSAGLLTTVAVPETICYEVIPRSSRSRRPIQEIGGPQRVCTSKASRTRAYAVHAVHGCTREARLPDAPALRQSPGCLQIPTECEPRMCASGYAISFIIATFGWLALAEARVSEK